MTGTITSFPLRSNATCCCYSCSKSASSASSHLVVEWSPGDQLVDSAPPGVCQYGMQRGVQRFHIHHVGSEARLEHCWEEGDGQDALEQSTGRVDASQCTGIQRPDRERG